MCDTDRLPPDEVLARLAGGARLGAGHRRRGAPRRRAAADQPEQAAGRALGGDHRGGARRRAALDRDGDVRPRRDAARAGLAHARGPRCRSAQEASPSSCRCRSSRSTPCSGRTHGIDEISREENLAHRGVPARARARDPEPAGELGEDGARRHRGARWGVNDLGGTLMEESISRMAGSYHGVKLEPDDLIGAAHRAGRPAAERTTLYGIRRRYELAAAA